MDSGFGVRNSSKKEDNPGRYVFGERKRSLRDDGTSVLLDSFFVSAVAHSGNKKSSGIVASSKKGAMVFLAPKPRYTFHNLSGVSGVGSQLNKKSKTKPGAKIKLSSKVR